MNEKLRKKLSLGQKRRWRNPVYREALLKIRRGRPLKEFLICDKRYWSESLQEYVRCRNERYREAKACGRCLDRIEYYREHRHMKHRERQTIFPWKYNGKKLELPNGEVIDVPKDHLFLDLTL